MGMMRWDELHCEGRRIELAGGIELRGIMRRVCRLCRVLERAMLTWVIESTASPVWGIETSGEQNKRVVDGLCILKRGRQRRVGRVGTVVGDVMVFAEMEWPGAH